MTYNPRHSHRNGFTLLELSIVLVILGLLAAGIVSGKNIIRLAEIRQISAHYEHHKASVQKFEDKYFGLPGDITDATEYWGEAPSCPGAGTNKETCNGDGDGLIEDRNQNTSSDEIFTFWEHLSNAGYVEGQFTGENGSEVNVNWNAIITENVPEGSMNDSCFGAQGAWANTSSTAPQYQINYSNRLNFGSTEGGRSNCDGPIMTAEEVWSLDIKMDDGAPASGEVIVSRIQCGTTADPLTAEYDLLQENSEKVCGIIFQPGW